jgi:hypothetical protein
VGCGDRRAAGCRADTAAGAYLEAPAGQLAWAAATVVAAAADPAVGVPEEVAGWLERHRHDRPDEARPLAIRALQRLLAERSELAQLWHEQGDEQWRADVHDLARRLDIERA